MAQKFILLGTINTLAVKYTETKQMDLKVNAIFNVDFCFVLMLFQYIYLVLILL